MGMDTHTVEFFLSEKVQFHVIEAVEFNLWFDDHNGAGIAAVICKRRFRQYNGRV